VKRGRKGIPGRDTSFLTCPVVFEGTQVFLRKT